jgi:hypothetical protein
MDGIFLGHNLLLSQASFSLTEFWLSQSLSHARFSFFMMGSHTRFFFFHDGISAITEPFSRTLSFFSRCNFGYHEAIVMNFSFFTMEFRLSGSLSHGPLLFSRWNFGYHEAIVTNFSFFTMEFRLSGSLSHGPLLFSRWNFETQNTKRAIWGKTLFIYISERVFT